MPTTIAPSSTGEMPERRQRIRRQRLAAVGVILIDERVRPVFLLAPGEIGIAARDQHEIALQGPVSNWAGAIDARVKQMVGAENWINSIANYATEKTLTKTTSNGQTWPERLAGATVWTKYHAWTVAETTRTERTHHGYQAEGNGGPAYIA